MNKINIVLVLLLLSIMIPNVLAEDVSFIIQPTFSAELDVTIAGTTTRITDGTVFSLGNGEEVDVCAYPNEGMIFDSYKNSIDISLNECYSYRGSYEHQMVVAYFKKLSEPTPESIPELVPIIDINNTSSIPTQRIWWNGTNYILRLTGQIYVLYENYTVKETLLNETYKYELNISKNDTTDSWVVVKKYVFDSNITKFLNGGSDNVMYTFSQKVNSSTGNVYLLTKVGTSNNRGGIEYVYDVIGDLAYIKEVNFTYSESEEVLRKNINVSFLGLTLMNQSVIEFMADNTFLPIVGSSIFDGMTKGARRALAKEIAQGMELYKSTEPIEKVIISDDLVSMSKKEMIKYLKKL